MQHSDLIFVGQNVPEEFLDAEMMHGNKP